MPSEFFYDDVPPELAESVPGAPLEAVLMTGVLEGRPSPPRDELRAEQAMERLMQGWSADTASLLQSLADTTLDMLDCDSSGISLINDERTRFWWPAVSGVLAPHVGGGTPIDFGPCGDVLNSSRWLLMRTPQVRYTYLRAIPEIREVLLVPFWEGGQHGQLGITGTLWAVIHAPPHDPRSRQRKRPEFDREDLRILTSLADLTCAAYKVWKEDPINRARSAFV